MSRIPALPYRVVVTRKRHTSGIYPPQETHNYASMAGAIAYRDIALRRPSTHKVETLLVLDESTPSHSV